jgi:PAS domain-containing protein/class 3 adenylate cyclase
VLERLLTMPMDHYWELTFDLIDATYAELMFIPGTGPIFPYPKYIETTYSFPLIYYFGQYGAQTRLRQFGDAVIELCNARTLEQARNVPTTNALVIVIQLAIVFLLFLILYVKSHRLKRPLSLLLFCDPNTVLTNEAAVALLAGGSVRPAGAAAASPARAVADFGRGVVLCDRDLTIDDVNWEFAAWTGADRVELRGRSFAHTVGLTEEDPLIADAEDAVRGRGTPVFTARATLKFESADRRVKCHLMCIGDAGAAMEAAITGLAIILEDLTDEQVATDALGREQAGLESMLEAITPQAVLRQLEDGADSVAFAVQSSSIGFIRVISKSFEFVLQEFADQVQFYRDVFEEFDRLREPFKLLAKVRTVRNIYVFAGGLLSSVNKPDKHAEEATRFCLALIERAPQIEAKAGFGVEFTIGLNTAGPLVAGVASLSHPIFQLIGPAFEIAEQLMKTAIPMQIHVTRAVYELIYPHNFRCTDRGEVKVEGDRALATYSVEL